MKALTPAAAALVALTAAPSIAAPLTVTHLRCEYASEPLGIDEMMPRLSWQVESKERAQKQKAYELRVASSKEALERGNADLWDSGKVSSDECTQIVYRGKPLTSGRRCYWQVRTWNQKGEVSPFSAVASWEMGLLRKDDWSAKWIGLPGESIQKSFSMEGSRWVWFPEGNPAQSAPHGTRYFRRKLSLPANRQPVRAIFWVAADNQFVLYANGKELGQGSGWQSATPVDVLSQLHPGDNSFALSVTNVDATAGPAGLLGRLQVQYGSGDSLTFDIDGSWKAYNQEVAGWQGEHFDDRSWSGAKVLGVSGMAPWGPTKAGGGEPGPAPYLRKQFKLSRSVRRARAYVSALGVFQLYLNGRRVGHEVLAPGWTDYRKRVQYLTYDVTDVVKRGKNAVGAIVGDGWYAGSLGFDLSRNHFGPDPARLRMQINVEYTDGSTSTVISDDSWKGAVGPILEADLYAGETYDARREFPGWSEADFKDRNWKAVAEYKDQDPQMVAHVGPPIRVTEELRPKSVTQPKPGVFVFDLGQNMVGRARLKVDGPSGTRVTLRFAEVLNPDGTVYRDNLRRARATDTFILRGSGADTFEPHFTYHGFRYVEVTGYPGKPGTDAILGRVFHSDMTPTSRFQTSSKLVNRLYRNITWGQRANLMSVPTDCPQRDERLGWMGDAQLFARTSCWNMDMAGFYTKWMRDIVDAQSPAGGFSDVSPRVVDLADGAPAWAEAGLVIPWTVYQCYGDLRILERNYDAMRRYVALLVQENPNLLWLKRRNNDFGDWVPAGEKTDKDLIASAYLAYDLQLLSQIAHALDQREDAAKYSALAQKSRAAFNARFLDSEGRYQGDTQTAYAMAIGMGLVPPERKAQVARRLAETVQRHGGKLATGFIGTAFLLPALSDTGSNELAYLLLQNTRYPSWGYMIDHGATTIWELWNSDQEGPAMNSRNHFAFGTVGEWMQRYLGGIDADPSAPGYKNVVIRPRPGAGITEARTEYDSQYGTISTEWQRTGNSFRLRITIPANTTATVYVPMFQKPRSVLTEGGEMIWRSGRFHPGREGVMSAAIQDDAVAVAVGSGTYEFVLDPAGEKAGR
jgi:alpha-L-rhamnosidase